MYVSRKLQNREGELDHKVGGAQAKVLSVGQTIHLGDQSPTTEMDALKQKQESHGDPMVPGTPGLQLLRWKTGRERKNVMSRSNECLLAVGEDM